MLLLLVLFVCGRDVLEVVGGRREEAFLRVPLLFKFELLLL